jgi:ElaB/YqjD/DUF883 family membrane-anchored ribosome-binding protein
MESTFNDTDGAIRADNKARKNEIRDAAQDFQNAAGQEARNLMADVQDLLSRVAHVADPEIARVRARVERGLASAKQTLADGTDRVQRHAKNAAVASDTYVREQPWQAVGIAAAAGLLIGFLVARR